MESPQAMEMEKLSLFGGDEDLPVNELPSTEPPNRPSNRRNRRAIIAGCAIVVALVIALGLGLGLGLHPHSQKSHGDTIPSTSGPTGDSGNSTQPSPLAEQGPGNSSQITNVVTRSDLLGDQTRWLMSERDFTVSSTPTTRTLNWTISEAMGPPGGMVKPMILVNGMSPGPVLEANFGDRLIINVFNNMTNETTIHWHGQYLRGQNFMDGTYSITQCGIPPGASMTYNWTVQNQGTSWYHAHRAEQSTDGLYGPIIWHSPNETAMTANHYDDDYTFMINDMYNSQGAALTWRFQALGTGLDGNPGDEPSPDGGMMNGISQSTCAFIPSSDSIKPERRKRRQVDSRSSPATDGLSLLGGTVYPQTNECGNLSTENWNVTWVGGHTYRIRLINSGTFVNTIFSIDDHPLTVIEADGISTEPYTVSSINLGVAQRYSVLVTLNQTEGAYWIRNVLATDQFRYTPTSFNETTFGILRYDGVSNDTMPADRPSPSLPNVAGFDSTALVPADKQDALPPTKQVYVQYGMQYAADNQHYMFFNSSSWSPSSPGTSAIQQLQTLGLGVQSFSGNDSALKSLSDNGLGNQMTIVNEDAGVLDLIINSLDDGSHPFHLHGHSFQVMSIGNSGFHTDSSSLSLTNPMRRDTVIIPAYGHAVLRIDTSNPGIWAFHCHITWHMEIGLLLTLVDLPDQIKDFDIPQGVKDLCVVDKTINY